MPNADGGPDARSGGGFWQRVKPALVRAEGEYSFVKGLTVLSVFGTLIGAYFQNLSAYETKVAAQAQADLAAAAQTFTETSSALAAPLSLQKQLITDYHNAIVAGTDTEANAYETTHAHEIYKAYTKAYLRHLIHSGEMLGAQIATLHNLHFYLWLVSEARAKILTGEFYNWKKIMVNRLGERL